MKFAAWNADCAFSGCTFESVRLTDCAFRSCRFEGCRVLTPQTEQTELKHCEFANCQLVGVQWAELVAPGGIAAPIDSLKGCVLKYAAFAQMKLSRFDFSGCELLECLFDGCRGEIQKLPALGHAVHRLQPAKGGFSRRGRVLCRPCDQPPQGGALLVSRSGAPARRAGNTN